MHKSALIAFLFVLCPFALLAQSRYIDSLREKLAGEELSETDRLEVLIEIGDWYSADSPAIAKEKYMAVYHAGRQQNSPFFTARSLSGIGKLFGDKYMYDSAMHYYLMADSLYAMDSAQVSKESRATNKSSIAEIQRNQSDFEAALKTYLETIALMEKSTSPNKWLVLAVLYSNAGSVHHDLHQPKLALEYDLKALEAYKKQTDSAYVAIAELFISGDYKNLGQPRQSRIYIEKAEKIANQLNSGDVFYRVYNAWGGYYHETGDYEKAINFYKKALASADSTQNPFRKMNCNRMLGLVYRDMGKYGESLQYLRQALEQSRGLQNRSLEAELLQNLAVVQTRLGNYSQAVVLYEDYLRLSDSLNQEETKRTISRIENKFQNEKKRDSILALQKSYQLQSIQLKQKNTVNLALAAGCVLLLAIAALFYKNLKNKKSLVLRNEELHAQQVSKLEKEKKLLAAQALMKGQEEERSRLARDLHDGVGGLLSGVKLSMSTMKGNIFLAEANVSAFEKVIGQLDQSIAELRRVSHNMMPEALIKYGLKEALENYCENLNISGRIAVQVQTYGLENRMQQSTEIVIYRIIQELLNNVIKHAEAKKVLIQLVREPDRFNLTVEDDGRGFDINQVKGGMGLSSIRARIDYLNGSMDISSKKGEGTSVHIEGDLA